MASFVRLTGKSGTGCFRCTSRCQVECTRCHPCSKRRTWRWVTLCAADFHMLHSAHPPQHLLANGKHRYVLDRACVQFEPDDPEYIRVSAVLTCCAPQHPCPSTSDVFFVGDSTYLWKCVIYSCFWWTAIYTPLRPNGFLPGKVWSPGQPACGLLTKATVSDLNHPYFHLMTHPMNCSSLHSTD